MSRAPSTFRQSDVTRALRAVAAAGVGIARIEIDKSGKIIIIVGNADLQEPPRAGSNEWDSV